MVGMEPSTLCDFFIIIFFSFLPIAFPYSNCFKRATWKGFSTPLSSGELGHMRKQRFRTTVPADVATVCCDSQVGAGTWKAALPSTLPWETRNLSLMLG